MGKRSTTTGYWRAHGDHKRVATAAVMPVMLAVTFDGAAANTTGTGKYLPIGAIVTQVDIVSGHTGGTTPAFDIGLLTATPDPDGIVDGAVSTTTQQLVTGGLGALAGAALTEAAEISAGDDGTGTAGTGNITAYITYTFDDDGVAND